MTCNDCVHARVCGHRHLLDMNPAYFAEQCEDFKDRSRFVEIPSKLGDYKAEKGDSIMREILFRGKRVDNGEWAYGSLLALESPRIICNTESGLAGYVVQANTIGQYTGICDKVGTRLFEGDLLISHGELLEVKYCEWTGHINAVDKNGVTYPFLKDMLVVGNIYDSAELLEGFE